jgi:hypothetical protein
MSLGKSSKCFNLPKELIEWLEELSNQTKISVDDFVASILYRFYEVWNLGKSYALEQQKGGRDLDSIAQEFIKKFQTAHNVHIVKRFSAWLKERGLTIDMLEENYVREFLEEYAENRNLSKNTLSAYKIILKKFIVFAKESSKISH